MTSYPYRSSILQPCDRLATAADSVTPETPSQVPVPPPSCPSNPLESFKIKTESSCSYLPSSTPSTQRCLDRTIRPNPHVFGHIPGVLEGEIFENRRNASQAGVHAPFQAGISGTFDRGGAESIVLNGGYPDGDCGEIIWYMGAGGFKNPLNGNKSSTMMCDQSPQQPGNRALQRSHRNGRPVRVLRGEDGKSPWAPKYGYRYDGLYRVTHATSVVDPSGYTSFKCLVWRLERIQPSEYTIPILPGYETRAFEKHKIGLQRKKEEDQPVAQSPRLPHPQSASPPPGSSADVFIRTKTYNRPLSNRSAQPSTIRRASYPQKPYEKHRMSPSAPSKTLAQSSSSHPQGVGSSEMKNVLKNLKFSFKRTTTAVQDPLNAPSPSGPTLITTRTATASPHVSASPPPNPPREQPSAAPVERRCSYTGWVSPQISPQDCYPIPSANSTTVTRPTSTMSPSPKSASPPDDYGLNSLALSTPVSTSFQPINSSPFPELAELEQFIEMEVDMLDPADHEREAETGEELSPLPSNDFTAETDQFSSDQHMDKILNTDLDGLPIKYVHFEELPQSSINNPSAQDFKPDLSSAWEMQGEVTSHSDQSSYKDNSLDGISTDQTSSAHPETPELSDEKKVSVGPLDCLNMGQYSNNYDLWLDGDVIKDPLDGIPIDYDETEQKYHVGGFELIDMDDELDGFSQYDDSLYF